MSLMSHHYDPSDSVSLSFFQLEQMCTALRRKRICIVPFLEAFSELDHCDVNWSGKKEYTKQEDETCCRQGPRLRIRIVFVSGPEEYLSQHQNSICQTQFNQNKY